jgi:xanthine dehydrogenase large subunit
MGWLTMEHLWWNEKGRLMTHAPSTYKIPVANDVPPVFNVRIWEGGANAEDSIYRSKAVGEPPLMLAISVHQAIKDAVASIVDHRASPRLDTPATAEEILRSVEDLKLRTAAAGQTASKTGVVA